MRSWAAGFVHWYHVDHRQSGIRYVSPARWSGDTRNGSPIGAVTLNSERDSIIKSHLAGNDIQPISVKSDRLSGYGSGVETIQQPRCFIRIGIF